VEFEPAIPASEGPQTHALDIADSGIGWGGGTPVHEEKSSIFTSDVTADIPKLHQSWNWHYLK